MVVGSNGGMGRAKDSWGSCKPAKGDKRQPVRLLRCLWQTFMSFFLIWPSATFPPAKTCESTDFGTTDKHSWRRTLFLQFNFKCHQLYHCNWTKSHQSTIHGARVNQQPPMHQVAVLSTGWAAFFHSAPDGVHHSPFFFAADHYTFFLFFFWVTLRPFFPWTWSQT
jgi:hypothetical protein